jgi:hypothetical protein
MRKILYGVTLIGSGVRVHCIGVAEENERYLVLAQKSVATL